MRRAQVLVEDAFCDCLLPDDVGPCASIREQFTVADDRRDDRGAGGHSNSRKSSCYNEIMIDTPILAFLSDDELLAEAKRLVANERIATAALLTSLMEIDTRRLYLREGCSSLFTYCTQILRLAEGAAYDRIEASRAAFL